MVREISFVLFGFFTQKSDLDSETIAWVAMLVYPTAFIAFFGGVCEMLKEESSFPLQHRHGEQTCGCQGAGSGMDGEFGGVDANYYI